MKYYWTIYGLWGKMREDGQIWITDGDVEGTVLDDEIILVCILKILKP